MSSILFLSVMNGGAWGGSEEQWFKTALWMQRQGHHITVCVFEWKEKRERLQVLRDAGINVLEIPNGRGLFNVWKQRLFLNKIDFKKFDLVYVNQGGWHDVTHGAFKTLYKRLPAYALSFHNYQLGSHQKSSRIANLKEWVGHARFTISATGVIYAMLREEFGIVSKNPEVSYSPVTFSPPPQPLPFPDGEVFTFLALGALDTSRKAQDVLIHAFAGSHWKTRKWKLEIYGEGRDKQMLEQLIREHGLEKYIFLMGHTNAPLESLKNAHILVQATRFDAMPISVMEAMCIGRPCLVSNVGDMPVWIQHDVNGFVVQKVNKEEVEKALEETWHKRVRIDAMGREAFETFQRLYPQPYEEKFSRLLLNYLAKR